MGATIRGWLGGESPLVLPGVSLGQVTPPAGVARANQNALAQLRGQPAANSPVLQPAPLRVAPPVQPAAVQPIGVLARPLAPPAAAEPPPAPQITQRLPALDRLAVANTRVNQRGGDLQVTFSPTIQVQGGGADVGGQVDAALQQGYGEFERNMRRFQQQESRVRYGYGGNE
ncbi:hypothetical protein D3C76_700550 [compost metagenome]